jgi:hypothetical protein
MSGREKKPTIPYDGRPCDCVLKRGKAVEACPIHEVPPVTTPTTDARERENMNRAIERALAHGGVTPEEPLGAALADLWQRDPFGRAGPGWCRHDLAAIYELGRITYAAACIAKVEGMEGITHRSEADEYYGRDGAVYVDRDEVLAALREGTDG